ncbi:DNA replication/repair protein RecF [Erysipelothrix urinaevulpis]|uniref:DNA replication/repair protein RecF n=1 Tax=Erysipelothrix urinaevulpis TaxID=2683717 RepID=UPI0013593054|nr:DNA replication/repair protein RecF [Erysipelothrix urinaevulpis]
MKIEKIKLRQFRNLNQVELEFKNNLNILVGNNGQGKTNFIESIVYLSSGRSFRLGNDLGLLEDSKGFARVDALLKRKEETYQLQAVISNQGKYFEVNQKACSLMSDFIGYCNVVLFNPDDLQFFSNTPKKRRREIDFELGKMSKMYMHRLSQASKILSERNAYLKTHTIDTDYLSILTESLIEESEYIIKSRQAMIKKLEPIVDEKYKFLSGSQASIELEYRSTCTNMENIKDDLRGKMNQSLQRDLDFKMTHVGIHRDDFVFKMNGNMVVDVASQGQKRLIILAYKLALVDMIVAKDHEFPILCLDDLFSELDKEKRAMVLKTLDPRMQVFVTTTDVEFVSQKEDVSVFTVVQGRINEEVSA